MVNKFCLGALNGETNCDGTGWADMMDLNSTKCGSCDNINGIATEIKDALSQGRLAECDKIR